MIVEAALYLKGLFYRPVRLVAAYHKASYSATNSHSLHSFFSRLQGSIFSTNTQQMAVAQSFPVISGGKGDLNDLFIFMSNTLVTTKHFNSL